MIRREVNKSILFFAVVFAMVFCDSAGALSLNRLRLKFGFAESVLGVLVGPFAACVTDADALIGLSHILMGAELIFSVMSYILSIRRCRWQLGCGLFFLVSWFCWLFMGFCHFAYWV